MSSVHDGVSCDGCMAPNFTGDRFKCLRCYDFDLCARCYAEERASSPPSRAEPSNDEHHPSHPMQCIMTQHDFELTYQGDPTHSWDKWRVVMFSCPLCGTAGLSRTRLVTHIIDEHYVAGAAHNHELVCPICISTELYRVGFGDYMPNQLTDMVLHMQQHHAQAQPITPADGVQSRGELVRDREVRRVTMRVADESDVDDGDMDTRRRTNQRTDSAFPRARRRLAERSNTDGVQEERATLPEFGFRPLSSLRQRLAHSQQSSVTERTEGTRLTRSPLTTARPPPQRTPLAPPRTPRPASQPSHPSDTSPTVMPRARCPVPPETSAIRSTNAVIQPGKGSIPPTTPTGEASGNSASNGRKTTTSGSRTATSSAIGNEPASIVLNSVGRAVLVLPRSGSGTSPRTEALSTCSLPTSEEQAKWKRGNEKKVDKVQQPIEPIAQPSNNERWLSGWPKVNVFNCKLHERDKTTTATEASVKEQAKPKPKVCTKEKAETKQRLVMRVGREQPTSTTTTTRSQPLDPSLVLRYSRRLHRSCDDANLPESSPRKSDVISHGSTAGSRGKQSSRTESRARSALSKGRTKARDVRGDNWNEYLTSTFKTPSTPSVLNGLIVERKVLFKSCCVKSEADRKQYLEPWLSSEERLDASAMQSNEHHVAEESEEWSDEPWSADEAQRDGIDERLVPFGYTPSMHVLAGPMHTMDSQREEENEYWSDYRFLHNRRDVFLLNKSEEETADPLAWRRMRQLVLGCVDVPGSILLRAHYLPGMFRRVIRTNLNNTTTLTVKEQKEDGKKEDDSQLALSSVQLPQQLWFLLDLAGFVEFQQHSS